ncbi:Met18p SCDLUD_002808 [Saccharomycodes ludwigii]|uniref:Met18p n=1 Tax=Saccharomycodes ludwigii TaxID=36035 RepID=UPI001E8331F8|nr:hypothetical protein SCDLUD_002808 [Saccharomycodes ludwigii]KAH3901317.1 hypothetical protein SCDLUD_002808 [Saccharomycodes ludwigii]
MNTPLSELQADILTYKANWRIKNIKKCKLVCENITKNLESKNFKLIDIILALQSDLTASDDLDQGNSKRECALQFLCDTLEIIPKELLLKNDVDVIFQYYSNKFTTDSSVLKQTMKGINSLVNMKWFFKENVVSLLKCLDVDNYTPTNHVASIRYFAFAILQTCFDNFKEKILASKELETDFIEAFLNVSNGEKDPKNLLLSFKLNKEVSTTFHISNDGKVTQDLFDTLFCYFPITFKPPKNDPYKITNQDLKLALRDAISACSAFGNDAFSNLLDKMTASSPSVKNDTLLTLQKCIDNYAPTTTVKYWLQIWNALKFEIIHNNNDEKDDSDGFNNYQDALGVIQSLSGKLYELGDFPFDKFLKQAFDDLQQNFVHEKDLRQSCGILSSIASTNEDCFNKVLKIILPVFFDDNELSDLNLHSQKLLMLNLSFFLTSYCNVFKDCVEDETTVKSNELLNYKDQIFILLSKALTGSSDSEITVKTLAIVQFTKLVTMPCYLLKNEVFIIVQYLVDTLLSGGERDLNKNLYHSCLEGLKSISGKYEDIVHEVALNRFLFILSDPHVVNPEKVLKIIIDFSCSRHKLVKESVIELSKILNKLSGKCDSEYSFILLSTIYTLINGNMDTLFQAQESLVANPIASASIEYPVTLKDAIFENLFELIFIPSILNENDNLNIISDIFYLILLKCPNQLEVYDTIIKHEFLLKRQVLQTPSRLIIPFLKMIASFDLVAVELPPNYLTDAIKLATVSVDDDETIQLGYLELCCLLVNKGVPLNRDNYEELDLSLLFWLAKGLSLFNSPTASSIISYLMSKLSEENIGYVVAQLFVILVLDIPIFQKVKGCSNVNVKALHKQKIFYMTVPKLVTMFKETDNLQFKFNYLTALSFILRYTPLQIKTGYIVELFPLLVHALEMKNGDVRVSSLQTIKDTLETSPDLLLTHVHTLVTESLKLIDHRDEYNTTSVRLLSLFLLKLLATSLPLNYLQPFQKSIITGLIIGLDDPKRNVRKAAVDARQAYYELGQVFV